MARKSKVVKPPREMTKRQLSRWQQQQKRQRIILITGISIITTALLLVLVGWYVSSYRPLQETVIRVNDRLFKLQYYVDMLKIQSRGQPLQYIQLAANAVANFIQRNELVRQEALKLGVSISEEEVKKQLREAQLPDDDVHRDIVRNQMLEKNLKNEYFDKQIPATTEQVHFLAMLLESKSQADEVRVRLEKGEDFATLAGELSLNEFAKKKQGDIGWHPQSIFADLLNSSVPGDYAFGSEAGVLSQPRYDAEIDKQAGYWLVRVREKKEQEGAAKVDAMLLGSLDEAKEVRGKLVAGQDFATLAKELSRLNGAKENGGDQGEITKGDLPSVADKFIFDPATKPGTLSEPIKDTTVSTKGGYWMIKVLEKSSGRSVDEDDRSRLRTKAFNDWLASVLANPNNIVESYLSDSQKAFAIAQVTRSQKR